MANRPSAGVPTLSRRARILIGVGVALLILLIVGSRLIGTYVDWLWYGAIGYREVFSTILLTRLAQFALIGVFIAAVVGLNLFLAYRTRPVFVPVSGPEDPLARYRTAIVQRIRLIGIGVPVAIGIIAGLAGQGNWQTVQLFFNGTSFGVADPEFGLDISFYAFELPFYEYLLTWAFAAIVLSFIAAAMTHYLFGGIRFANRGAQVSGPAKVQLAALAGIFVLLQALDYWFDRYQLLFQQHPDLVDGITGATYTDLNAVLPAKIILLVIAVICAVAFFVGAFLRNLQLPAIATVLLVLSGILVGAVWPALLQQFSVAPNQEQRETLAIDRNITATQRAYDVTNEQVRYRDYTGDGQSTRARLAANPATVSNLRLLDPAILDQTFTQLQQRENFYGFPNKLDIDRYTVDGELQDYVVAVRELATNQLAENQRTWINQHLRFTHGDGFVAARADRVNAPAEQAGAGPGGFPVFTVSDTSGSEVIPVRQPRIYYGELIDHYVIVGGSPNSGPGEFELDGTPYRYQGQGGVRIGNFFNELVFAAFYGERNIVFNEAVSGDSRVIFRQNPRQRVETVAPWLTADSDAYPAVVNGRVKWIVDAYTTLDQYPYAQRTTLGEATQTSLGTPRLPDQQVSYIRNSVKATVDAYSGKVTLYAWQPNDPVLRAWRNVFSGTVEPRSAISPALRQHFRYPRDLFKVQREMLRRYHVNNPQVFFSTQDFWSIPSDPTVESQVDQPPYYVLAGPPAGNGPPSFQLTTPFTALRRDFMASYLSVSSDPRTYGQMTVLQLPTQRQTEGPQQVFTKFRSSAEVSQELNLLQQSATDVLFGNLLTLPTGEGTFIYVQPIYVQRTNQDVSFPQLNRVLVFYGDRVGYAPSLQEALSEVVVPGGATLPTGDAAQQPQGPQGQQGSPSAPTPGPSADPQQQQAAADIATAIAQLREAQQSGDFAAQGEALEALDEAVTQYQTQAGQSTAAPADGGGAADGSGTTGAAGATEGTGTADGTGTGGSAPAPPASPGG